MGGWLLVLFITYYRFYLCKGNVITTRLLRYSNRKERSILIVLFIPLNFRGLSTQKRCVNFRIFHWHFPFPVFASCFHSYESPVGVTLCWGFLIGVYSFWSRFEYQEVTPSWVSFGETVTYFVLLSFIFPSLGLFDTNSWSRDYLNIGYFRIGPTQVLEISTLEPYSTGNDHHGVPGSSSSFPVSGDLSPFREDVVSLRDVN